jgi:uncharacterized protein (DUF2141 family)
MRYSAFSFILICVLLFGCASMREGPTGGVEDKTPPELKKTTPENQAKNFQGNSLRFKFDSYLKPVTYGKEIFISPLLSKPPKITLADRHIVVKFQEPLRENTTYVVTLSELEDFFSNQKMTQNQTFAFSTGDVLDSMKISGVVKNGQTDAPEKDLSVFLFSTDSIKENDFFKKRPDYVAKTNEEGVFSFSNLRKQKYKIYALKDADNSNTYNQLNEVVGMSKDSVIGFSDSLNTASTLLISFLPDAQAPNIKSYEWLNDNILAVEISETLLLDSLKMEMQDTLMQGKKACNLPYFLKTDKKQLLIETPRNRNEYSILSFKNMSDSLGNQRDSLLRILPNTKKITLPKNVSFLQAPKFLAAENAWQWINVGTFADSTLKKISILDSANKEINTQLTQTPFRLTLQTNAKLFPKTKLKIRVPKELFAGKKDTVFQLFRIDASQFGTLKGKLTTTGYEGKVVLILSTGGGTKSDPNAAFTYIFYNRNFEIKNMPAGKYSAKVILDADGNGCWTTGTLKKHSFPERIINVTDPIDIRANWDLVDFEIKVSTEKETGKGFGGKKGEKEGLKK